MLSAFRGTSWSGPIIVLDLGHSAHETTGLLLPGRPKGADVSFGEAIRTTSEVVRNASKPVLVIVEAVLSCSYDVCGNPAHRARFERRRTWWIGAGAIVALAAQRFVSQIASVADEGSCFIVEAFLSHKLSRTCHAADAEQIRSMWQGAEVVQPQAEWIPWAGIDGGAPQVRIIPSAPSLS